uniref:Palmitoyltransferase n=1 Tax=Caenorhabditis tropicalis TaxID=1561998 RepID=A0A1I7T8L5_9PELO
MSTSSANLFLIFLFASSTFIVSSLPLIGIRGIRFSFRSASIDFIPDDISSEFVGVGLRDDVALPIQKRRVEKSTQSPFCIAHRQTFDNYCDNFWADRPARLQTALFTFCPGYENKCLH